ncbi:MAG: hypothetical protein R6X33_04385 [Candidatus Brocadiia bacterium]
MEKAQRDGQGQRARALAVEAVRRGLWNEEVAAAFVLAAAKDEVDLDFWEKALAGKTAADATK